MWQSGGKASPFIWSTNISNKPISFVCTERYFGFKKTGKEIHFYKDWWGTSISTCKSFKFRRQICQRIQTLYEQGKNGVTFLHERLRNVGKNQDDTYHSLMLHLSKRKLVSGKKRKHTIKFVDSSWKLLFSLMRIK